jgi:hypothetical protein
MSEETAATIKWRDECFRDLEGLVCDLHRAAQLCLLAQTHASEEKEGSELFGYQTEQVAARVAEFKKAYYDAWNGKNAYDRKPPLALVSAENGGAA